MNYHTDDYIMERLREHYAEALHYFDEAHIVGIFLQGSQNYQLETENSDIDTKLIVLPTLEDIIFNKTPSSTTHVRENNEHIDFKDIRLMFQTFRKQNINFIEVLFTKYKIINPRYAKFFNKLIDNREKIAHYNTYIAVKAMKGMALEKFHAMEHLYPTKIEVINKYGYDPKQLHHLVRFEEFMLRYLNGEHYEDCLTSNQSELLLDIKNGKYNLEEARSMAQFALKHVEDLSAAIAKGSIFDVSNIEVDALLDNVLRDIIKLSLTNELKEQQYDI